MLHLNCREFDPDESKLAFAIRDLALLSAPDKLFLNELSKTVTDTNLYQVSFIMESNAPLAPAIPNVILPAILLYAYKLEFILLRLKDDLLTSEELLYDMVPREALREAMLTNYSPDACEDIKEEQIRKIVQTLNKKTLDKAFNSRVGALQEEIWRLRDEEGEIIEDDEEKMTEILGSLFIHI